MDPHKNNPDHEYSSLHLDESKFMKKELINMIINNIEGLSTKWDKAQQAIIDVRLEVQQEKEASYRELIELKNLLDEKLQKSSADTKQELEKATERLSRMISQLRSSLNNVDDCVDSSIKDHSLVEEKRYNELKKKVEDLILAVQTISDSQLVVTTKVKIYIALVTLGTTVVFSAIGGGILMLFKDAIKAWIGS